MTVERGGLAFNVEGRVACCNRAGAVDRTRARVAEARDRAPHDLADSGAGIDPAAVGMHIAYADNSSHMTRPPNDSSGGRALLALCRGAGLHHHE